MGNCWFYSIIIGSCFENSVANEVVEVVEEEKNQGSQQSVTPKVGQVAIVESEQSSISIVTALASVGNTLDGTQLELVLEPLRLAFETKNIKLVESALDCLHVRCPLNIRFFTRLNISFDALKKHFIWYERGRHSPNDKREMRLAATLLYRFNICFYYSIYMIFYFIFEGFISHWKCMSFFDAAKCMSFFEAAKYMSSISVINRVFCLFMLYIDHKLHIFLLKKKTSYFIWFTLYFFFDRILIYLIIH